MSNITEQAKAGHAQRVNEQDIPDEGKQPRQWMVYGICIVTAKDRKEANAKAIAGELDKPWESMDDVGGFYEPEPAP